MFRHSLASKTIAASAILLAAAVASTVHAGPAATTSGAAATALATADDGASVVLTGGLRGRNNWGTGVIGGGPQYREFRRDRRINRWGQVERDVYRFNRRNNRFVGGFTESCSRGVCLIEPLSNRNAGPNDEIGY